MCPALRLLIVPLLLAQPAAWAEPYRKPDSSEIAAIRRWLCPHGGRPVRGKPGRCDGARSAGGPAWDAGLRPPQRDTVATCPAGTRPVPARGHSNIIRCLPG
jgi:hypothetical protein